MGRGPSIEGRKNAEDAKRAKVFTKLIREITVAARAGGDPAGNPRLRMAMDKASGANMPRDTVERAIKRGTGELEGQQLEEIRYEGYGPGGVAIMVDCMTDNRTRTVGEIRHAFSRNGGNLGADGSVAYLFKRLGLFRFEGVSEDRIMEVALDAGADDVQTQGSATQVIAAPEQFEAVGKAFAAAGLKPVHAEIGMQAGTKVAVAGAAAEELAALLHAIETLDDVQHVFTNAELPAGAAAAA